MSSYLTFYLVPKKTRKKYVYNENDGNTETVEELSTGKPLALFTFSRNNEVYQAYSDSLNPAYGGMEEKYTEVTYEDSQKVVNDFEEELKKTEQRLAVNYKMLKEGGYSSELWEEIHSAEEYLLEQKDALNELKFISDLIYECTNDWTDFEKVLINVD